MICNPCCLLRWMRNVQRYVARGPMHLERIWHDSARHDNAHPKLVVASVAVTLGVMSCVPFVIAGTWSLGEARAICEKSKIYSGDLTAEKLEIRKSDASNYFSPAYELNILAAVVSLVCFSAWLFCSPHASSARGGVLDRQREFCCPCCLPCSTSRTN